MSHSSGITQRQRSKRYAQMVTATPETILAWNAAVQTRQVLRHLRAKTALARDERKTRNVWEAVL